MPKKKHIWKQIIQWLKDHHPEDQIHTWFSNTDLYDFNDALAVLEVPNKFVGAWIEESFCSDIQTAFQILFHITPKIEFRVKGNNLACKKSSTEPNIIQNKAYSPNYTFKNFITDANNRFAFVSALEFSNRAAPSYNPLYIFGQFSAGKTHLIHAIANNIIERDYSLKTLYTTCDRLYQDFSRASRNGHIERFRENICGSDVLLLDNIDLIAGKRILQSEVLRFLEFFIETKRHIAIAGKYPPSKISGLNEKLLSRLEGGLLAEIKAPGQTTKVKILRKRARDDNLTIPEDVLFFLATISDDIQSLYDYYIRILAHSSLHSKKIDMSVVKGIVESFEEHSVNLHKIQTITANYFNIPITDLLSGSKKRSFSYPRQVAMFLAKEFLGLSYKDIASGFFRKDHSTVIYSIKNIQKKSKEDPEVNKHINELHKLLL